MYTDPVEPLTVGSEFLVGHTQSKDTERKRCLVAVQGRLVNTMVRADLKVPGLEDHATTRLQGQGSRTGQKTGLMLCERFFSLACFVFTNPG